MSKKRVEVVVDWREERGNSVLETARGHDEVADVALAELDVGDIVVREFEGDGMVAFERKTPSDFANSMMDEDGHMREQVERLKEATDDTPRVLIEGDMADFEHLAHTQVPAKSLRGFVASLEERDDAAVKFCSDLETLVDYAVRASRKRFEDRSGSVLRVESAVKKSEPFTKRVYGCLDGVGAEMAARLYEAYPTLPTALEASVDDFQAIEGIGEVRAKRICEELHGG